MLVASDTSFFRKLMAGTVLVAYITGLKVCIDIAEAIKNRHMHHSVCNYIS